MHLLLSEVQICIISTDLDKPAYPPHRSDAVVLSGLPAAPPGGVWVCEGGSDLLMPYLALSRHALELSGLPPLCQGLLFSGMALFTPAVMLT